MIGRTLYHAKRLMKSDPRVVFHREVTRRQILKSAPLAGTTDPSAEVHVLTSTGDWLNLIWSLKSFYAHVPAKYALCIHGDPNLPAEAVAELKRQFPDARVIEQRQAQDEVLDSLSAFPRCKAFRETNTLSIKSFDFAHYLNAEKMILFDSDLLFFAEPTAFLEYLSPSKNLNVFNRDVSTAYAVELETIKAAGFDIHPEVNSGFGVVHKSSMRHDWMEEFLSIPGLPEGHFWRIEQTLFALCGTRYGIDLLPDDYQVFLQGSVGTKPYRHYVGAVRDKMYAEGMARLKGRLIA